MIWHFFMGYTHLLPIHIIFLQNCYGYTCTFFYTGSIYPNICYCSNLNGVSKYPRFIDQRTMTYLMDIVRAQWRTLFLGQLCTVVRLLMADLILRFGILYRTWMFFHIYFVVQLALIAARTQSELHSGMDIHSVADNALISSPASIVVAVTIKAFDSLYSQVISSNHSEFSHGRVPCNKAINQSLQPTPVEIHP